MGQAAECEMKRRTRGAAKKKNAADPEWTSTEPKPQQRLALESTIIQQ